MNPVQLINILAIAIAGVALVFLVRYLWGTFSGSAYAPVLWKQQKRNGSVPEALVLTESQYPDKTRFWMIWFQLKRILDDEVPGALAELGVYKGETARMLHHAMPDRKLYLFDTFEGFPAADLEGEHGEAALYTTRNFADTSVEKVLKMVGSGPNIIIRKGYFPETAAGLEDQRFSLVTLDADLYKPTIEGLRFFYPRLSPGGVIFIHDHDERWPGLMRAVSEFAAHIPETFIQVPDMHSTVMLVRNKPVS